MAQGCPVVVPAAGASLRMGRPKPLLDFGGRSCIDLVVGACREAGCGPVYVVLGADRDKIRPAIPEGPGIIVLVNEHHERGQTGSVKCGLLAVAESAAGFLIFPVDHPLVESADLRRILEAFDEAAPEAGVFPVFKGRRGHPILLGRGHRAGILALGDGEPLHDYVRPRVDAFTQVEVDNAWVVASMNTEREYLLALEEHRRRERSRAGGRPSDERA